MVQSATIAQVLVLVVAATFAQVADAQQQSSFAPAPADVVISSAPPPGSVPIAATPTSSSVVESVTSITSAASISAPAVPSLARSAVSAAATSIWTAPCDNDSFSTCIAQIQQRLAACTNDACRCVLKDPLIRCGNSCASRLAEAMTAAFALPACATNAAASTPLSPLRSSFAAAGAGLAFFMLAI